MQNFILVLSVGVGLVAGVAAFILKTLISFLEGFTLEKVPEAFFLILPLIGILLTLVLAKYVLRDPTPFGVTDVLFAVSRRQGVIPRVKTYSRLFTSAVTVAFGGSVGLEAPILVTGSALGSNLGRWMHLDARKKILLLGCGASAGMAAIFNCPVAGILFSMEVILTEYHISSFIPLLLASATGSLFSIALRKDGALFAFDLTQGYSGSDIPFFILIGLFVGLVSVHFTRVALKTGPLFKKIRSPWLRALLGGTLLGILIFLFPPVFGEGYSMIMYLMNNQPARVLGNGPFSAFFQSGPFWILVFFLILTFLKIIAASLTVSAGGVGGKFAPSLFTGGMAGYFFAIAVNQTGMFEPLYPPLYILAGMSGVISGVMHAPLTGIFLIAEITESYGLFVPLMIVSALSYFTKTRLERHSIYTKQLADRGDLLKDDKDKQVLSQIKVNALIERDLLTIHESARLRDLLQLVESSSRNIFPVVSSDQTLAGMVTLDDIRPYMFHSENYDHLYVGQLMQTPPAFVREGDSMERVMELFDRTEAWNLPVVDEKHRFVGLVSKSHIFSTYRHHLKASTVGILD